MRSRRDDMPVPGIDRDAYEPAYAQVVRILSEEIAQGVYRPGDQLPSESQLCTRFDVSGMTVRRAINIMVDRGTVNAAQGKGTFVRGLDMSEAVFRLRERHAGSVPNPAAQVRVLQAAIVPADERVGRKLEVTAGNRVIFMRRLVFEPEGPMMYHREYMVYDPRKPTVETELQITSLEGLFRGHPGQGLRRGDLRMEAVVLDREEAEILGLPLGAPALCLEHIFHDFENRPVSWGWFICRADRFSLVGLIGPEVA